MVTRLPSSKAWVGTQGNYADSADVIYNAIVRDLRVG